MDFWSQSAPGGRDSPCKGPVAAETWQVRGRRGARPVWLPWSKEGGEC